MPTVGVHSRVQDIIGEQDMSFRYGSEKIITSLLLMNIYAEHHTQSHHYKRNHRYCGVSWQRT